MTRRLLAPLLLCAALLVGVAAHQAGAATTQAVAPPMPVFLAYGSCQVRLTFQPYAFAPFATVEVRAGGHACAKVQVQIFGYANCGTYCSGYSRTTTSGKYPAQYSVWKATLPCCTTGVWARAAVWTTSTSGDPDHDWVLWTSGKLT